VYCGSSPVQSPLKKFVQFLLADLLVLVLVGQLDELVGVLDGKLLGDQGVPERNVDHLGDFLQLQEAVPVLVVRLEQLVDHLVQLDVADAH
jgi:hypothetical protein